MISIKNSRLKMLSPEFKKGLKISAKAVWYILSATIMVLLAITFLFPDVLMKAAPVCISKSLYGQECFMCGTTKAFIEISKGNFSNAYLLNKLSIILFSLFILNTITFFFYSVYRLKRKYSVKKYIFKSQVN